MARKREFPLAQVYGLLEPGPVVLVTTTLRGNRWELNIPKLFLKPGAFHLQQIQSGGTAK